MTTISDDAREAVLKYQADAALAVNVLGPFEQVVTMTGGYQAEVAGVVKRYG